MREQINEDKTQKQKEKSVEGKATDETLVNHYDKDIKTLIGSKTRKRTQIKKGRFSITIKRGGTGE